MSIYVIEDSIGYQLDLKKLINKYFLTYNISDTYDLIIIQNYNNFYETLEKQTINDSDIFIVDIQLNSYIDGIDFGVKLRSLNKKCKIIYLTSATNKAADIINHQIIPNAYLMKSDDLSVTQMQLSDLFQSFISNDFNNNSLHVTSYGAHFVLSISEIVLISVLKGHRNKLKIHTVDSSLVVDGTLSKMKPHLSSPPFYLDFKSIIINYEKIKKISTQDQTISFINNFELTLNSKLLYKLLKFQKELK